MATFKSAFDKFCNKIKISFQSALYIFYGLGDQVGAVRHE
jgi:hypothetical protein